MVVLPNFLYLFQHIPIFILKKKFFHQSRIKNIVFSLGQQTCSYQKSSSYSSLKVQEVWHSPTLYNTTGPATYKNFCSGKMEVWKLKFLSGPSWNDCPHEPLCTP
ncbi:hypothetical protein LDENG_00200760 [Lucifuga dentata]|nr:hypothetical protein LDENG_00200760 [Lucifuga dentata]